VLETSVFLVPLLELLRSSSPLQGVEPFRGQDSNAGKELDTRGIYAVGIATHDEGKFQFDRSEGLSYDDMICRCEFAAMTTA